MSLDIMTAAGAESREADTKWPAMVGSCPCSCMTYKASTVEAIVPIPAASTVVNSDRVMCLRWGFTTRADSTPTNILLEALSDSAPLMRINRVNTYENPRMIRGMIFK